MNRSNAGRIVLGTLVVLAAGWPGAALAAGASAWAWGSNELGQLGDDSTIDRHEPVQVHNLTNAIAIAGGRSHSLALRSDGTVWAWGWNAWGQLGDDSSTDRHEPVQVVGLTSVVAIACGGFHSLALKSDGTVWAWGMNENGQVGDGSSEPWRARPVQVLNLSNVTAIAAGLYHSLALKRDGTVWAWGCNTFGGLGDGTTAERHAPVQVVGLTGVVAIDAGAWHSLAVRAGGTVWAWGGNLTGQLGDGSSTHRLAPVQTQGLTAVVAVAGGEQHSLALASDGTVWAWGNGWLGDWKVETSTVPKRVPHVTATVAIAAGQSHSLALQADGTAWAWGMNLYGEVGDGSTSQRTRAVQVHNLTGVAAIAAGGSHSLALVGPAGTPPGAPTGISASDGTYADRVRVTWVPSPGALGYEVWRHTTNDAAGAIRIDPFVSGSVFDDAPPLAGTLYFYWLKAVNRDGTSGLSTSDSGYRAGPTQAATAWAWGNNQTGQLGDNTTTNRYAPVRVHNLSDVVAVAARGGIAYGHGLALERNGTVWAWGRNFYGQLGDGTTTDRLEPVQVQGLPGIVAAGAGLCHSLALDGNGAVWAWGWNGNGQLGDNSTTDRGSPMQVPGLTGVAAIAAGWFHSLALRSDGTVWAWGSNTSGQLGDGTTTQRLLPVQVQGLSGVVAIAAGTHHGLAIRNDGTVWAWGSNSMGQLGDGSGVSRATPGQVSGPTGAVAVAGGAVHSLALTRDGKVWAWGEHLLQGVGGGDPITSFLPAEAPYLTGIVAIGAGHDHSLAVASDGTAWAWGNDGSGALGNGLPAVYAGRPVQVQGLTGVLAARAGALFSLAVATGSGAPPEVPTSVAASDGTYPHMVRVTWAAPAGATSFEVWRGTTSNPASATRIAASLGAVQYDDTSASVGTTYTYWVAAVNAYGTSALSSPDSGYRGPLLAAACVDDGNTTGEELGTAEHPFDTIQEGVAAVADGGTVKVARGTYRESVTIAGKSATIRGGYVGRSSYPGTGDFSEGSRDPNPASNQTDLDGDGAPTQVICQDAAAHGSVLDGLTIRNGGAVCGGGVQLKRVTARGQ